MYKINPTPNTELQTSIKRLSKVTKIWLEWIRLQMQIPKIWLSNFCLKYLPIFCYVFFIDYFSMMYFVYTIIKKIASKINTYFKWFMKQEMKEKESEKWAWQMYAMYIRIEPNSANTNCPIIVFKYQCTLCELLTERPIYYSNNNAKIETKTSPVMLMVCIFLYVLHLFYRIDCHYSNRKHTLLRAACCHIISTIRLNSFISVRI